MDLETPGDQRGDISTRRHSKSHIKHQALLPGHSRFFLTEDQQLEGITMLAGVTDLHHPKFQHNRCRREHVRCPDDSLGHLLVPRAHS